MHQMKLPKESCIRESIVRELHHDGYMGPEYVLPELKKKYWIIKERSLIKQRASKHFSRDFRNAKISSP